MIIAEQQLRKATNNFVTKINESEIIMEAVQDARILSHFENISNYAEMKIEKESSINLLEQLIGLLISIAKGLKEKHKLKTKRSKKTLS